MHRTRLKGLSPVDPGISRGATDLYPSYGGGMHCVSCDICVYHLGLFVFFPGVFLSSRVTGTCTVTTDLIMRVNVTTTTTILHEGINTPQHARSKYHTQLAKLNYDQNPSWSIAQLTCFFFIFQKGRALLDTRVRCLTTTKKWYDEIQNMHKKKNQPRDQTRARRPTIRSGSKHLDFTLHNK